MFVSELLFAMSNRVYVVILYLLGALVCVHTSRMEYCSEVGVFLAISIRVCSHVQATASTDSSTGFRMEGNCSQRTEKKELRRQRNRQRDKVHNFRFMNDEYRLWGAPILN